MKTKRQATIIAHDKKDRCELQLVITRTPETLDEIPEDERRTRVVPNVQQALDEVHKFFALRVEKDDLI